MHSGPAVPRAGDWFGATVNLAARVAAAASGSEVLLTEATRQAAGPLAGVELHERGRGLFKNVAEPVDLYAATRVGTESATGLPIDPVCRMAVEPAHSAGRLAYDAVKYTFCSLRCANLFSGDPRRYAAHA